LERSEPAVRSYVKPAQEIAQPPEEPVVPAGESVPGGAVPAPDQGGGAVPVPDQGGGAVPVPDQGGAVPVPDQGAAPDAGGGALPVQVEPAP